MTDYGATSGGALTACWGLWEAVKERTRGGGLLLLRGRYEEKEGDGEEEEEEEEGRRDRGAHGISILIDLCL